MLEQVADITFYTTILLGIISGIGLVFYFLKGRNTEHTPTSKPKEKSFLLPPNENSPTLNPRRENPHNNTQLLFGKTINLNGKVVSKISTDGIEFYPPEKPSVKKELEKEFVDKIKLDLRGSQIDFSEVKVEFEEGSRKPKMKGTIKVKDREKGEQTSLDKIFED